MGSHEIGISTIKRLVDERRGVAKLAMEEGISLGGVTGGAERRSENLKIAMESSTRLVDNLIKKGSWVEDQLNKILALEKYSEKINQEKLVENFKRGLSLALKQEYAVVKKMHGIKDPCFTEKELKKITVAYTADFVSSLLHSHRAGITLTNALEIAVNSYRNPPNSFALLSEKYPDMDRTTIIKALTSHSSNPEVFLKNIFERLKNSLSQYPEFVPTYVKHIVVHYSGKKCEDFLHRAKKELDELKKIGSGYEDLPDALLQRAIFTNPSDVRRYLDNPENYPKGYKRYGGQK